MVDTAGSTSKLYIHMPDRLWLGEISRKFPHYGFTILSFIPISQDPFIGNSLIKITGTPLAPVLIALDQHPSLQGYFVMEENPTQITLNIQTKDNYLLQALVKNHILVKLPVEVDKGIAIFNVHSSRENIDQFIADLNTKGIHVDLKILGAYSADTTDDELTARQLEVYKKAKELGFYDSPRRITLTELAAELHMAKSSLSALLQRVHKKLLGS